MKAEGGRRTVQADGAGLGGNVGMPDMGGEVHLGRLEGVLVGDPDVKLQAQMGAGTPSASKRWRQR